ncbi:MAG TPA: HNH endonuclease domain-containing protein [Candidatus Obscuribacterales bacterium]
MALHARFLLLNVESTQLPPSARVDVRVLSRLFNHVSTSYKFLFFLALLDACEKRLFSAPVVIPMHELIVDMLVLTWYPHVYFKLSFGWQDKVARELDSMPVSSFDGGGKFAPWDKDKVRARISLSPGAANLVEYVPYRLIRPFFPQIKTRDDHRINGMVKEAANEYFAATKPLYKISADDSMLTMHPDWLAYFHENLRFVRAWASWHYLQYMQKINPTVPSLANKLFPPAHRESLKEQTDFWNLIASNTDLRCIYSGERILPGAFDVDHFLPWSFVVHNELWNLVPANAFANSAKSDRLPDERYIDQMVATQRSALIIARDKLPEKKWTDNAGIYPLRLNLSGDDWLDSDRFVNAYRELLSGQLTMAYTNGFERGWSFKE